jgi:hypothetical protein
MKCSIVPVLLGVLQLGCTAAVTAPPGSTRPGGVVHPSDPAGLFERLRAGNIDQPGSRAYNRWGMGYEEGISASDRKLTRAQRG